MFSDTFFLSSDSYCSRVYNFLIIGQARLPANSFLFSFCKIVMVETEKLFVYIITSKDSIFTEERSFKNIMPSENYSIY